MTISFVGSASNPLDAQSYDSVDTPCVVTPVGAAIAGDLVVMLGGMNFGGPTRDIGLSSDAGQTWTQGALNLSGHNNTMFWCQFNGAWTDAIGFANSGASNNGGLSAIMLVFRSDTPVPVWSIDQPEQDTLQSAPASPFDVTTAGQNPTSNSSVTLAWWFAAFPSIFTLQTAGWINPSGRSQWWNNDSVGNIIFSAAYKIQNGTTADTGNVVNRENISGGVWKNIITFTDGAPQAQQGSVGQLRKAGPGVSPGSIIQFQRSPRTTDLPPPGPFQAPAGTFASLTQPGPANQGPFRLNQMLTNPFMTDHGPPAFVIPTPPAVAPGTLGFVKHQGPGIGPGNPAQYQFINFPDPAFIPGQKPVIIPSLTGGCIRRLYNITIRHR